MTEIINKNKCVEFTYSIFSEEQMIEEILQPIKYVHQNQNSKGLWPRLEQSLEGKKKGDSVSVVLEPENAFGTRNEELVFKERIEMVPKDYQTLGKFVELKDDKGQMKPFFVSKIDKKFIYLDGNHPLAGKKITFKIKILDVREATKEELEKLPFPTDQAVADSNEEEDDFDVVDLPNDPIQLGLGQLPCLVRVGEEEGLPTPQVSG